MPYGARKEKGRGYTHYVKKSGHVLGHHMTKENMRKQEIAIEIHKHKQNKRADARYHRLHKR